MNIGGQILCACVSGLLFVSSLSACSGASTVASEGGQVTDGVEFESNESDGSLSNDCELLVSGFRSTLELANDAKQEAEARNQKRPTQSTEASGQGDPFSIFDSNEDPDQVFADTFIAEITDQYARILPRITDPDLKELVEYFIRNDLDEIAFTSIGGLCPELEAANRKQ